MELLLFISSYYQIYKIHIFIDAISKGMSARQPVAVSSRPICNIQHWQNVHNEAERTLSTETSSQAVSSAVLYQQQ